MLFIVLLVAFVSISVFSLCSEHVQEKIVACVKDTCKWALVCGLVVTVFLAMFILLPPTHAEEQDFREIYGKIVAVDLNTDEVYVETFDGEVYVFFAAGCVKTEGDVYLLIFGEDEIIDIIFLNQLEAPFGEFSIFYF